MDVVLKDPTAWTDAVDVFYQEIVYEKNSVFIAIRLQNIPLEVSFFSSFF